MWIQLRVKRDNKWGASSDKSEIKYEDGSDIPKGETDGSDLDQSVDEPVVKARVLSISSGENKKKDKESKNERTKWI